MVSGSRNLPYLTFDPILEVSPLAIYNRWGKLVYESLRYKNDWNASGLASGIYSYELLNVCNERIRGTIHVMR